MRPKQVFWYACFFIILIFELVIATLLFLLGPPMGKGLSVEVWVRVLGVVCFMR